MQNKFIPRTIFLFSFFFIIFLVSCRRQNPSWDLNVLAPLVKSTLTINNIIPDSVIHKNSDNSLEIVYNNSLYSFSSDKLFKIPDTTLTSPYTSPVTTVVNPGGSIIPVVLNDIQYSVGSAQLTQVIIRSGKMLLTIKSGIKGFVDFNYKIPSMKSPSGNIFDTTVTITPAIGSSPGIYTGSFDLSGYIVNLTGSTGTSVNTMTTSYNAIVSPIAHGGYTTTINQGDNVQISNSFISIVPQYAKGYFGSTVTNVSDSTNFSLFRHIISGNLNLQNVNIGLSIENSVGADARITINNLLSVNSRTGIARSLTSTNSAIGSPININRAVDNNGNVAASTYSVSFTPANSNILAFVDNLPDKLVYKMNFEINPLVNISGNNDFIYYDKLINTNLNMTIPLSLIANNLTMADTMNFTMNANLANVNSGNLYLYFENGFPFTAQAQLFLMNGSSIITDSLISSPNVITPPPLDINSICIGQSATKLTIPLDAGKLSELRAAKKMYVKIKFNTANQPNYIKIYSFYQLNLRVVGDFNYTVGKKN